MKKTIITVIFLILTHCILASIFNWKYISNDRFTVFYPKDKYINAKYLLNNISEFAPRIDSLTGNSRKQEVKFVIEESGEYFNGFADSIHDRICFFNNTPTTSTNFVTQDWFNTLAVHEYTHHSHLTNAHNIPKYLSMIMGNIFSPNMYSPMWIVEGITVYNESQHSPYLGRLNDGYYDAIIMSQKDDLPNIVEANYDLRDFPRGAYYIYGSSFIEYLSNTYGEEKLTDFFNYNGSSIFNIFLPNAIPMYTIDRSAKHVFGKNFPQLFKEWNQYYKNYDFPEDPSKVVPNIDWENTIYISSLTTDFKNNLFYCKIEKYFNHYRTYLCKYDINTKTEYILKQLNSPISTALKYVDNKIYYTVSNEVFAPNNIYNGGFITENRVIEYDLLKDKSKNILCEDFKSYAINKDNVIYFFSEAKDNKVSILYSFYNGTIKLIKKFPFLVSESIYNNNKLYVNFKYPNSSFDLGIIDLDSLELQVLNKTESIEKNLLINDNILYFTSAFNGYNNAYSFNLINGEIKQLSDKFFACNAFPLTDKNGCKSLFYMNVGAKGERVSYKPYEEYALKLKTVNKKNLLNICNLEYEEHNAFVKNLSYLYKPYLFTGLILGTGDGIGFLDTTFEMTYNDPAYADKVDSKFISKLAIETKFLQPFTIKAQLSNQKFYRNLQASLNIVNSSSNYWRYFDLYGKVNVWEDYISGTNLGFKFFNTNVTDNFEYSYETQGYSNYIQLNQMFKKFSLGLSYEKVNKFNSIPRYSKSKSISSLNEEHYEESIKIPSYSFDEISLSTKFNLFKVRNGLWTPNIAIKDINSLISANYNNLNERDYENFNGFVYGECGIETELYLFNVLSVTLQNGIYFTNKKYSYFSNVSVSF